MTCRDCIHHDVCKDFIDTAFDGFLDDGDEVIYDDNNMRGDDCEFYQARSRFVELPCKDGEYVYVIEPLCDSMAFHTIKHRKIKHIKPQARIQFAGGGWILDFLSAFNRYVFRTYEEAEQALKERNEADH